jgi:O-antigen ligase
MAHAFFSSWDRDIGKILYNSFLVVWVIGGYYKKTFRLLIKYKPFIFMVAFLLLLSMGILWSSDPQYGKSVLHRYGYLLLIPVFIPIINKKNYKYVAFALMGGLFLILINSYLIRFNVIHQENPRLYPAFKITYQDVSFYLGVLVVGFLYFALHFFEKKQNIKAIFSLILILPTFYQQISIYVQGRGAIISMLAAIVVLFIAKYPKHIKKVIPLVFLFIVLVSWLAWSYSPMIKTRFSDVYKHIIQIQKGNYLTSLGHRWAYFDVGTAIIAENPFFGIGTGEHKKAFNELVQNYKGGIYFPILKSRPTYHFHNDYIEIAVQIGLVGLLLYILTMYSLIRILKDSSIFPLVIAILTMFWVNGLSDVMFVHKVIIFFLAVFLALSISEVVGQRSEVGGHPG